jgi:hypothetical protein
MPDPAPVIRLDYAKSDGRRPWRIVQRSFPTLVLSTWAMCVIACIAIAAYDVESVLVSGPVIFILGALLIVAGAILRRHLATLIGAGHCAICLLFFALVNIRHWGPSDAHDPFLAMGALYVLATSIPSLLMYLYYRRRDVP